VVNAVQTCLHHLTHDEQRIKPPSHKATDGLIRDMIGARPSAAWRPNSIKRVFAGWSDSANSLSRSRIASQKEPGVRLVLETGNGIAPA
jgi:hypothetical protein